MSSGNQCRAGSCLEGICSAPGFANPRAAHVSMGWTPSNILAPLHVMIQTLMRTVHLESPPFFPPPATQEARPLSLRAGLRSSLECTALGGNERAESSSPPGNSPDTCGDVSDGLSSSLHFINFLLSDA